jgi:hypothetical protein
VVSGAVAPAIMVFDADRNYTISGSGVWTGSGAHDKRRSGTLFVNDDKLKLYRYHRA